MSMGTITSTNAVYVLNIATLFPIPQQLVGWTADDAFITEPQQTKELYRGIDGVLSAGLVLVPVPQTITLSADSPSNAIFDFWHAQEVLARDVFFATAIIYLNSIKTKYILVNGVLNSYMPLPDVQKALRPRKFGLTFESSTYAPITGAA